MRRIFFVNSKTGINSLTNLKIKEGAYIALGAENFFSQWCQEQGLRKINFIRDEAYVQKFIKDFILLVGSMGNNFGGLWWMTDIASKNRFTSKLPEYLRIFFDISEGFSLETGDLIVINAPWQIFETVCDVFRKQAKIYWPGYFFDKYKSIVNGYSVGIASAFFNALKIVQRIVLAKVCLGKKVKSLFSNTKKWYVIKSFSYDASFKKTNVYEDPFFGPLPDFLNKQSNVFILTAVLGDYKRALKKIRDNEYAVPIVPVEFFLSFRDVIVGLIKIIFLKIDTPDKRYCRDYDIVKIIKNDLMATFNGVHLYHLLHFNIAISMIKKIDVNIFLCTYENNPWERAMIMGLRKMSPKTMLMGYQHAVVVQSGMNMFASMSEIAEKLVPDKIFTVGKISRDIMKTYGDWRDEQIVSACGLRFSHDRICERKRKKPIKTILVVLEGIKDVRYLVDYIFDEFKANAQYGVIIRTHPVLPWSYFEKIGKYVLSDYPQIEISQSHSLTHDLELADVVVYWGTTVALQALQQGIPVIHFKGASLLSYDPLFQLHDFKWEFCSDESLKDVIHEIDGLNDQEWALRQQAACEYVALYFFPVTELAMNSFTATLA